MKYAIILSVILALAFALPACHKNNNPVPAKKDSTVSPAVPTDSATGIVVLTEANDSGIAAVYSLFFFNPDGTLRWKRDPVLWEALSAPGYADGTLYLSTLFVQWNGVPHQSTYLADEELYALDPLDGSVKWSHVDSTYATGTPAADSGEIYLPQQGFIQGYDAHTGAPNWSALVANGLLWTPLIDGDTLYTATAPMYTGYYSIVAIDKNTGYPLWTTPVGYNPPEGILLAGGKLVFTAGAGALMALDKGTGAIIWSVQDQQYSGVHVVSGNTLFTFNNTSPLGLYAFDLATGGQLWQIKMSNVTDQFGGLWMYGKNVCFYAYEYPNSYLETLDPATGDSISRVIVPGRYESPLLVGHRIYARKSWDNTTNTSLASPQFVVLDAASLAVKDSAVITGFEEQITSMLVIGKSGATY